MAIGTLAAECTPLTVVGGGQLPPEQLEAGIIRCHAKQVVSLSLCLLNVLSYLAFCLLCLCHLVALCNHT